MTELHVHVYLTLLTSSRFVRPFDGKHVNTFVVTLGMIRHEMQPGIDPRSLDSGPVWKQSIMDT